MKQPHKHAELIKAWADGATIEFNCNATNQWIETKTPEWRLNADYRIKPEPVVKKMYMHYDNLENIINNNLQSHASLVATLFERSVGMSKHLEFVVTDGKLTAVNIKEVN